jgi:hypothetical protein
MGLDCIFRFWCLLTVNLSPVPFPSKEPGILIQELVNFQLPWKSRHRTDTEVPIPGQVNYQPSFGQDLYGESAKSFSHHFRQIDDLSLFREYVPS